MELLPTDTLILTIRGADGSEKYRLEQVASDGTFVVPPPAEPAPALHKVIGFSQRDPRWASIHLGGSRYTMGGSGCAVTSGTMCATFIDLSMDPLKMVTWLNANHGFVESGAYAGNLYWGKVAEAVPGMRFIRYLKWETVSADLELVRIALAAGPQIIGVDFKVETRALETHFCCAIGFTEDGQDIEIVDPWTKSRTTLMQAYSKPGWTLARAIYSLVEYRYDQVR